MRLIDADELKCKTNTGYFHRMIDDCKTVDAVPVVRCRDCKWSRECNEFERKYLVDDILICTNSNMSEDSWNAMWPDDFCSYGERKDGAD